MSTCQLVNLHLKGNRQFLKHNNNAHILDKEDNCFKRAVTLCSHQQWYFFTSWSWSCYTLVASRCSYCTQVLPILASQDVFQLKIKIKICREMLVYKLHPCSASDWAKNFNFSVTAIYLQQKHWHRSVIIFCYIEELKPNTSRISGTNNMNNVIQYKNFSYKLNTSQVFFFASLFPPTSCCQWTLHLLLWKPTSLYWKWMTSGHFFMFLPVWMNEWWFMSNWNSSLQTERGSLKHQSPTYSSVLAYLPWWF